MIKIDVDDCKVIVDHNHKNVDKIADELIKALDIICADLYVNTDLPNDEKVKRATDTRNKILTEMTKKEFWCEEYFD